MKLSSLVAVAARLVLLVGGASTWGCHRSPKEPVISETTVTAAPLSETNVTTTTAALPEGETLDDFRINARGNIANLEARMDVLEARARDSADDVAASQARLELARAREHVDTLRRDVDGMVADRSDALRAMMDSDWEAANASLERAGELLTDPAR